jgi:prepilin-type N-terminal cleavage/methylation domain-containing protein
MHERSKRGFTLVEILVAVAILAVIVLTVARLFHSAALMASTDSRRFDADAHARAVFDRFGIDLAKLLRRSDLDYYLKDPSAPQTGNDQLAFFCELPGYYPSSGSQSSVSVVAYRINALSQMERMGKGLVWNGVSSVNAPLVFLPVKIADLWPAATNASPDADYEVVGAQAFRFEYYYVLKSGVLASTPWDTAGHTAVAGFQDVAAVGVAIATIDPKSRTLLSNAQLTGLSGTLPDFQDGQQPGDLANQWQNVLDGTSDVPRAAISSMRIYQRYFNLARP